MGATILCGLLLGGASAGGRAAEEAEATNTVSYLRNLSLDDLLHKEVTSPSMRPEKMFEVPSAVFSIDNDELRRSGVRTIPEALRLVPGMNVARMDSHTWAISARGFNDLLADRMLVMIDGRTVYSPLFSGVNWDIQDTLLEDVERIEVIRGPGGTLWGANAVNGVVNVITKDAKDTQGVYATGGAGNVERGFVGGRYGGRVGEDTFVRGYVQGYKRDNFPNGFDDSEAVQGGFRADWQKAQNHVTLQGDGYAAKGSMRVRYPSYEAYDPTTSDFPLVDQRYPSAGGNVLFRFQREFSSESDLQLQAYYDRAERNELGTYLIQNIFDVQFQHRFPLPLGQNLNYGVGYRCLPDTVGTGPLYGAIPQHRNNQVFSGFVQDEIELVEDRLRLTFGTKLEHNDYTDWETQPSARLAWLPSSRQTVWAAVTRAVQVPGRLQRDATTPTIGPGPVPIVPALDPAYGDVPGFTTTVNPQGQDAGSQKLMAYELGYRLQPADRLSFDVAGFYNQYSDFLIFDFPYAPEFSTTPYPHNLYTGRVINGGEAETYGFEVSARWSVLDTWRLTGSYALLIEDLDDTVAYYSIFSRGRDPKNQASLRSSLDLPANLAFDAWLRYVDHLSFFHVDHYLTLDLRLGWKPSPRFELAVVGQNLVQPSHLEFGPETYLPTQVNPVPRSFYLQVTYRY